MPGLLLEAPSNTNDNYGSPYEGVVNSTGDSRGIMCSGLLLMMMESCG